MADVRSLLKNERAARRIQHKHASYSTTGSLLCIVCHLQLKSETLWQGHLRSPGHLMRLQKFEEEKESEVVAPVTTINETNSKKRKALDEDDSTRKRNKQNNGIPDGFFDTTQQPETRPVLPSPTAEIQIPSRPATPSKPVQEIPIRPDVDEDEWAAFEADIAAADVPITSTDAIISAPAISAAELAQKSAEESPAQRKERQEAELEGEKEDAARKMEEELDAMEDLEQRVRRLREKREKLRRKESMALLNQQRSPPTAGVNIDDDNNDDEDDEDDDDWDGFRMKRQPK